MQYPPYLLAALGAASLSLALPVLAQANNATAENSQQSKTLPEVTVSLQDLPQLAQLPSTGSNLELTSLETAASVQTISQQQLRERGDSSVVNAVTRAAGISSMGHPGNIGSALSARGFTDSTSVMQLYDGTRQYGGAGLSFPFDTWSIAQIEVLLGPSAVIYGDGAIGGVINVIPKKPSRGQPAHEVQLTAGNHGHGAAAFGSGGAINEQLSYRIDVSGARSDGWVERGDTRGLGVNAALRWDLTPQLNVQLSHAYARQKPQAYFGTPLVDGRPIKALRNNNYNVEDASIVYRDHWTELAAQWAASDGVTVRGKLYRLSSARHWRNSEGLVYNDASGMVDRSDNTEIGHDQAQTGVHVDTVWRNQVAGMANQTSFGFDFNDTKFTHTNNTYVGSSGPVDLYNPVPGLYHSDIPYIPRYRNKAKQYALFAENRLELTDRWSVIGGLRYDYTKLSRFDLVANNQAFERNYSNTSWRIGSVYKLQPNLSLYAQYATAVDPVASMLLLSPANSSFDMSTGKQMEVGIKQVFWDNRGEWTLAAYSITKNNLLSRDPADPSLRVQVGERTSKGLEATLSLAPTPKWQLDFNMAMLRARYKDFNESSGGVSVSRNGNVPTDVPERLANAWASYKVLPDWTLSGGVRYVGKRYANNANTMSLPGYTTADLAVQWQASPQTTVTLRGINVTNKYYFTTTYYTNTQWLVGEGRRFELTLNHRF